MRLKVIEHMCLHAAFVAAEFRPSEHGKVEWDGREIESVGGSAEHENVHDTLFPCLVHHEEGEILEYEVVSVLVGDGKRVS